MTGTRIYVPADYAVDTQVALPDAARDHLRARRLRPGDGLTLFDGDGVAASGRLERLDKRTAVARVASVEAGGPEPPREVLLLQGMLKSDAMDTVVQKATELGVSVVVPVYTDNAVVRLKDDRARRKLSHWGRVAISACEQCGRNTLPRIEPPRSLADAVAERGDQTGVVISQVGGLGFGELADPGTPLILGVGPEGGLSHAELAWLTERGWQHGHLGPRVLRAETAAIAGLTALGMRFTDIG